MRHLIALVVCIATCVLSGCWVLATFPVDGYAGGLLIGVIAGLIGAVAFWLAELVLMPFLD